MLDLEPERQGPPPKSAATLIILRERRGAASPAGGLRGAGEGLGVQLAANGGQMQRDGAAIAGREDTRDQFFFDETLDQAGSGRGGEGQLVGEGGEGCARAFA